MSRERLASEPAVTSQQVTEFKISKKQTRLRNGKLGKGKEDYFDLLENASDIIQSVGPDGRFLYVNRTWRETLGYSHEESTQLSLFDIIHPDSQAHCMEVFQRVISGESVRDVEAIFVSKDGRKISVDGSVNCRFEDGKPVATRGVFRNITERKQAEIALRKKEDRYRSVIENLGDIVYVVDMNGIATYISPIVESALGYSPSEIIGQSFTDFIHQEDLPRSLEGFQSALSGQATIGEYRLLNKAGDIRWVRSSNRPMLERNRVIGITGVLSDITERKQMEEALQESGDNYRELAESITDIFFAFDSELKYTYWNKASEQLIGVLAQDALGKHLYDIFPRTAQTEKAEQAYLDVLRTKQPKHFTNEYRIDHKEFVFEISAYPSKDGISVFTKDITERRQADERLKESEKALRLREQFFYSLMENASDGFIVLDVDGIISYASSSYPTVLGYSSAERIGAAMLELIHPDDTLLISRTFTDVLSEAGRSARLEVRAQHKDGSWRFIEATGRNLLHDPAVKGITIAFRDITDRRQTEEALRNSEEKYRNLVENSQDSVIIVNIEGEVQFANKASEGLTGYTLREGIGMNIAEFIPPDHLEEVLMKLTEAKSGKPIPYFESAIRRKDGTVAPIETGGQAIIKDGEAVGIQIITRNIAERKWAEEELRQSLDKLLRTSEGTIQAMAATIESRDPYTAGHQRRVAELSGAIARDMELREDQLEGIRMAAIIHDIGKIYIPAEILSKPGQLSNVEFSLIRMHPQAGYDILKNIDFPWPVADIVLGHHERLDGSGYPLGLIDDDISLEARILGVADVVEAISSHRPYRPAIGIDKALDEISRQNGILYDPAVVNTCLRLFAEKGFRFSDETTSGTSRETRNQHIITAVS